MFRLKSSKGQRIQKNTKKIILFKEENDNGNFNKNKKRVMDK